MSKQEWQGATTNEYSCGRENTDLTCRRINCGLRSMSECEVHLFFSLLRDFVRTSSSVERTRIAQALSKQASAPINFFACGCRFVLRQPGASAVDCRSTRFVFSGYTCRSIPPRDGSSESSKPENAKLAISVCDICTVVSGGVMNWASRMSSNPMTDRSRGILRERSNAAR